MTILYLGLSLLCFLGAFFLLVRSLFSDREFDEIAEARLGDKLIKVKSKSALFNICAPLLDKFIVPYTSQMHIDNFRKEMKRKLVTAGMEEEVTPDQLYGLKILIGFVFPVMGMVLNIVVDTGFPIILFLVIMVIGYFYPELWVNGRIKQRHLDIRLAIPFVMDMLTLSIEAGLDFLPAVTKVVTYANPSALIDEFQKFLNDVKLGATRSESLRQLSWRINMQEISSLVAILVTADQMGISISGILRQQADTLRNDRFMKAEKMGAYASQKILFPLVFFIMPAIFIIIFAPVGFKIYMTLTSKNSPF